MMFCYYVFYKSLKATYFLIYILKLPKYLFTIRLEVMLKSPFLLRLFVLSIIFQGLDVAFGSFSGITEIANTRLLNNLSAAITFKSSFISSDGTWAIVGYNQNGTDQIALYNLTTSPIKKIISFDRNGSVINVQKLCITSKYLIVYSSSSFQSFYFNLTNGKILGNITLQNTSYVLQMIYLQKRNIIVYSTKTGDIYYCNASINQSTISKYALSVTYSITLSIMPSNNQDLIGISTDHGIIRLSLDTLFIASSLYMYYQMTKQLVWAPDDTSFYFSFIINQTSYLQYCIQSMANISQIESTSSIVQNLALIDCPDIVYLTGTQQFIVVSHFTYNSTHDRLGFATTNLSSGYLFFQYSIYVPNNIIDIKINQDNNVYFTTWNSTQIQFWKLEGTNDSSKYPTVLPILQPPPPPTITIITQNVTVPQTKPTAPQVNLIQIQNFNNYQQTLSAVFQNPASNLMNSLPGSRKLLSPIFAFFVNFDDIWLYNYHSRQYNRIIDMIFAVNQKLESEKWNCIDFKYIESILGLNLTKIQEKLNYKLNYTSQKFISVEGNSNGFLINSLNYFFSFLLLALTIYFSLRILFNLLSNFKISKLLISYSFWPTCAIMLLEGNIQYLSYIFMFQTSNYFFIDSMTKFSTILTTFIFFSILFVGIGIFFILLNYYRKASRYFLNNYQDNLMGLLCFVYVFSLKNLIAGFLHYSSQGQYRKKLFFLFLFQVSTIIFLVFFTKKDKSFQRKYKAWILIYASASRILMIFIFRIDFCGLKQVCNQGSYYQPVYYVFVYFYVSLIVLGILLEVLFMILELKNCKVQIANSKDNQPKITEIIIKKQKDDPMAKKQLLTVNIKKLIIKGIKCQKTTQFASNEANIKSLNKKINSKFKRKNSHQREPTYMQTLNNVAFVHPVVKFRGNIK